MGSFRSPFATPFTTASYPLTVVDVTLPASGVRYPNALLRMLRTPATSALNLFAPVAAAARSIGAVGPVSALFELAPLPFAIAPALRACRGGCPTFYLGIGGTPAIVDGAAVTAGQALATAPTGTPLYFVGVLMQDRLALDPWAWIRALDDAMAAAGEPASDVDRMAWAAVLAAVPGARVRLFEASGAPSTRPLEARTGTVAWSALTTDVAGHVLPAGAGPFELRLNAPSPSARPLFSLYLCDVAPAATTSATAASDPEPATFMLPAGARAAILQVTDLDQWFAVRPAVAPPPFPGWTPLGRYHLGSRTEPVVDGYPAFAGIVDDLRNAMHPGCGAHFTGLTFKDFPMIEDDPSSGLVALSDALDAATGTRPPALIYKYLNLTPAQWTQLQTVLGQFGFGLGMAVAGASLIFVSIPQLYRQSHAVVTILLVSLNMVAGAIAATILGSISNAEFRGIVEGLAEASNDIISDIAAIWSRYPATLLDNPLAADGTLPLGLQAEIDHLGSWHQKLQLIRRQVSATDPTLLHVAWVGGIDIDPNRADHWGHRGKPYTAPGQHPDWTLHPWHDVHARITGAAASDLFKTWNERYEHELALPPDPVTPMPIPPRSINPPPEPSALTLGAGPHVVQIGRTYFRPGPGRTGFAFAPAGETTINEVLLKALAQSRDYIYIEDQYFTPPGEPGDATGGAPDDFTAALAAAASTGSPDKKLIILVPSENDQPFGVVRRRHLYQAMREAWGPRVLIGSPQRPPILAPAGNYAHEGRCFLLADVSAAATELQVGPLSRVPGQKPFWLWVDGELMLCSTFGERVTVDEIPGIRLRVYRSGEATPAPVTHASPRAHRKGAPVTMAQLKGIYVHAKVVIVDDVFVSIGTSNLNRRGMYHDGEVNAFTVPRTLLAPGDNPARALRTQLWAEHLGLSPVMGGALLADVPAAFELWKRAVFAGNRFAPIEYGLTRPYPLSAAELGGSDGGAFKTILKATSFAIAFTGAGISAAILDEAWRKIIDPTTSADPHPMSTIVP